MLCCTFFFFFFRKQLEDILNNQKEKPDVGTLLLVSFISNLLSLILLLHVFEECKLVSCYCKLEEVELTIFSYIYIFFVEALPKPLSLDKPTFSIHLIATSLGHQVYLHWLAT